MGIAKRRSFTLIELIVAVGVIGIVLPTVFNIFFIIIRQQLVLVAYQTMKQQGDSAERNIRTIIQERALRVTDNTYTTLDECPPLTTPTPTFSPVLYMRDHELRRIKLYGLTPAPTSFQVIASDSASTDGSGVTQYQLTSQDVVLTDIGFSCYRTSEFNPAIVNAQFTIHKSTAFKEISLPYSFRVKMRY